MTGQGGRVAEGEEDAASGRIHNRYIVAKKTPRRSVAGVSNTPPHPASLLFPALRERDEPSSSPVCRSWRALHRPRTEGARRLSFRTALGAAEAAPPAIRCERVAK